MLLEGRLATVDEDFVKAVLCFVLNKSSISKVEELWCWWNAVAKQMMWSRCLEKVDGEVDGVMVL